jgi:Protein of unknown function (DUF2970)
MLEIIRTIKAVLWAFLGIRKNSERLEDAKLKPHHIIITGLFLALVFVLTLILIVKWVVATS